MFVSHSDGSYLGRRCTESQTISFLLYTERKKLSEVNFIKATFENNRRGMIEADKQEACARGADQKR